MHMHRLLMSCNLHAISSNSYVLYSTNYSILLSGHVMMLWLLLAAGAAGVACSAAAVTDFKPLLHTLSARYIAVHLSSLQCAHQYISGVAAAAGAPGLARRAAAAAAALGEHSLPRPYGCRHSAAGGSSSSGAQPGKPCG